MRVDYTLPAIQPGALPELPAGPEAAPTFREHLRTAAPQVPVGWEQQLGLDARPFTGTYIGPPPRPHTLQLFDAATERSRWRSMLWRHSRTPEGTDFIPAGSRQAVHTMLEMLLQMQQMEDSIVSLQVAVTRG